MIALLLAGVVGQTDGEWLNLNGGDLIVRNVKTHRVEIVEKTRSLVFSATGQPVQVIQNPKGATLSGNSIAGTVRKLEDGTYKLDSADVKENGKFVVDSTLAHEKSKAAHPVTSRSTLASNDFTLRSTDSYQTVTLPGSLTFDDDRHGTRKDDKLGLIPFDEKSLITGSSGALTMTLGAKDLPPEIQSGAIEGPVHYHSIRTEHRPKELAPTVTEYDVTADRLVLDFTKPNGTITASGHVHWSETGELPMSGVEDTAVLTFDADHQIESVSGSGEPTTTIVPLPKPKAPTKAKKNPHGGGV